MEDIKALAKFMGGASVVGSPKSDFEFIKIIRLGLPSNVIECVVQSSAVSEDVINSRYIPEHNFHRPDR